MFIFLTFVLKPRNQNQNVKKKKKNLNITNNKLRLIICEVHVKRH